MTRIKTVVGQNFFHYLDYHYSRVVLPKSVYQAKLKGLLKIYFHRKALKRKFRKLWIQRLSAVALIHSLTYNEFTYLLKTVLILYNRKVLSQLVIFDIRIFSVLAVNILKLKFI